MPNISLQALNADFKTVSVTVPQADYDIARVDRMLWHDCFGNPLFESWHDGDAECFRIRGLQDVPAPFEGLEFHSIEAVMFFAGYLDRHLRDTGH